MKASKMKEGTLFNVTMKNGGVWLNCYFKDGIVYREIGDKLAASIEVFNADWEIVEKKSLSDKIVKEEYIVDNINIDKDFEWLRKKDVKDFIKTIKKRIRTESNINPCKIIDEEAGKKLI